MKTVDEIEALVASMQIPQPPTEAADSTKIQGLQLQLLQSIACSLAAQNASATKGAH
jgi:hypothetical protein